MGWDGGVWEMKNDFDLHLSTSAGLSEEVTL
jgi:hypothetical protein